MTTEALDAERAFVGALLVDDSLFIRVAVNPSEFTDPRCQKLYLVIEEIVNAGRPVNQVSLRGALGALWPQYDALIASLRDSAYDLNIEYYADRIRDAASRRDMLDVAGDLAKRAHQPDANVTEARAVIAGRLLGGTETNGVQDMHAVTDGCLSELRYWTEHPLNPGEVRGVSTGLVDLDRLTGGFLPSLWIVAGRPSMGKSQVGAHLAQAAASRGMPALYISLELTARQMAQQMAGARCDIDLADAYTANLTRDQVVALTRAHAEIARLPLSFYEGDSRLSEIQALIYRQRQAAKIGMVVIDNLDGIHVPGVPKPYDRLGLVMKALASLKLRLNLCIVCLHQLNRGVESRDNRRPTMSDLRDSGYIEQDADLIAMLYRDGYYNPQSEKQNILEVAVMKNRVIRRLGVAELFSKRSGGLFNARRA